MSEYLRQCIGSKRDPPPWKDVRFRCAFHNTIYDAFKARNFKETENETDWDVFWSDKEWIHDVFDHIHLKSPNQRINHFRNHYELTRKDLLIKNIKRAKRQAERDGNMEEARMFGAISLPTFVLPQEYSMFTEEFKRFQADKDAYWIMKPVGKSQGKGIFLFNQLKQIADWKPASLNDSGGRKDGEDTRVEPYVCQKYLSKPLLIGGKKFDLRIYVLVTSFSPLVVYMYRSGFARFSSDRFSMAAADISNFTVHLTNVAIQKQGENYDQTRGGKWDLCKLKRYLTTIHGNEKIQRLFYQTQDLVLASLLAVQKVMMQDKHCFELYGYDVMVSDDLTPTILEVNASPSLTANTPDDYHLKFGLLDDTLTILDPEKYLTGNEEHVGGFDLIYRNGVKIGPPDCAEFRSYLGCANTRMEDMRRLATALSRGQMPPGPPGYNGHVGPPSPRKRRRESVQKRRDGDGKGTVASDRSKNSKDDKANVGAKNSKEEKAPTKSRLPLSRRPTDDERRPSHGKSDDPRNAREGVGRRGSDDGAHSAPNSDRRR